MQDPQTEADIASQATAQEVRMRLEEPQVRPEQVSRSEQAEKAAPKLPEALESARSVALDAPQLTLPSGTAGASTHAQGPFPMCAGAGLAFQRERGDGTLFLAGLTGRGPMLPGPTAALADGRKLPSRYCLSPMFQPRIVRMEVSESAARCAAPVPLTNEEAKALYGLPPREAEGEVLLSLANERISGTSRPIHPTGVALARDDTWWVADAYGPALRQFSAQGLERALLRPGAGLPGALAGRAGVLTGLTTLPDGRLLTIDRTGFGTERFLGVIIADPVARTCSAHLLPVEPDARRVAPPEPGDVAALTNTEFLLLERFTNAAGERDARIVRCSIAGAEDVSSRSRAELMRWKRSRAGCAARGTLLVIGEAEGVLCAPALARGVAVLPDGRTVAVITHNGCGAQIRSETRCEERCEERSEGAPEGAAAAFVEGAAVRDYVLSAQGELTLGGERTADRIVVSRRPQGKTRTELALLVFRSRLDGRPDEQEPAEEPDEGNPERAAAGGLRGAGAAPAMP